MAEPLATPAHFGPSGLAKMGNPISRAAMRISAALHAFPPFLTTIILVIGALVVAAITHRILLRAVPHRIRARHAALDAFVSRTRGMLFIALAIILLSSVVPAAPLAAATRLIVLHILSAAFIVVLGWAAIYAIDVLSEHQVSRNRGNIQADVMARRHATQWQVLRRLSHVVIALLALAAALMVFPAVREYGVSLLASAGAAGLVLGFAARPVLSNLIAGIQLAITQPFRIEDAVVINGQWGWIEEITATYVVVRIWNWQRMVVPLAWLLEQPFQNWTRESSELIGTVHMHVDYTLPVEVLRRKLDEIVRATPLWDGKVVVLQVVEALPTTIQLRALVSARNSGEAWDLRCYVREKIIAFLQEAYPRALPRQRFDFSGGTPPARGASEESPLAEAK
ncbi:MAG TPA: mechanosensitive ion channel domain-containing protein [Acetobacteraceae bacterium]|nr:mechanosensitive ion channel domain-containing protein [Acetobacteraceae bacterium]